ncbi:MAG TPA: molecular chaperone TorD family protein [Dehalococcoidia bacterium]|nr:molecular chaperone TorD family protein [Dehalococcoidia bacterium]
MAAGTTSGPDKGTAEGRSDLCALLSRSFAFPQQPFHADLLEGRWLDELSGLLEALPYRLDRGAAGAWRVPEDYERFQSEYIRLFEVGGRGGAPCPLYSGHYAGDRLRAMEELVRFYSFFGLSLSPGLMPDHVTVELEFMHFLSFQEIEAKQTGEDQASYLRAQRDFLQRQMASWWPLLSAAVKRQRPLPFYRSLVALTGRVLDAERSYLERALSRS